MTGLVSATWIKYIVAWAIHHDSDDSSGMSSRWPKISVENKQEIIQTFSKVQILYTASKTHIKRDNHVRYSDIVYAALQLTGYCMDSPSQCRLNQTVSYQM